MSDFLTILAKENKMWIAHALSLGATLSNADDIIQNTYIKLHKYATFDKIIVNNKINYGYVYLTIRSEVANYYNKESKFNRYTETETEIEQDLDSIVFLNKQHNLHLKIEEVLDGLEWYDAEVFRLYRDSGLSFRTMAKQIDISHVSLHGTVSKVKAIIKEELKDWFNKNITNDY
jgi:RNA polymerase sigma factor (sigma-70 family)